LIVRTSCNIDDQIYEIEECYKMIVICYHNFIINVGICWRSRYWTFHFLSFGTTCWES